MADRDGQQKKRGLSLLPKFVFLLSILVSHVTLISTLFYMIL